MRQLLVLRPEPGASATVKKARERGLDAVAAPLFEIEPVSWEAPESCQFDGLLLTSANAVRHSDAQLEKYRSLPVYAVGEATAAAALERGLSVSVVGDRGIDQLLDSISPRLKLLHLCGEVRRSPSNSRTGILAVPVYRARETKWSDPHPETGVVALIHSPEAGRRFATLVQDRRAVAIAAISPEAGEAVGTGWESLEAAKQPSDDALLALAARLCNKPVPK